MYDPSLTASLIERPLESVADYYASRFSDKARRFLEANCLSADPELRVGFGDRTLGRQLPPNTLKVGRELRRLLTHLGILKKSGHEQMRGFVTLPLTDLTGKTTGIYGLRVDKHSGSETQLTIGGGLFGADALKHVDEIIFCQSLLDAWTFYAAGYKNAVAAQGVQLEPDAFQRIGRVLLAGTECNAECFASAERMQIHFPEGMTANTYAKLNRAVPDPLGTRIRAASWIGGAVRQSAVVAPPESEATENTNNTEPEQLPEPQPEQEEATDDCDLPEQDTSEQDDPVNLISSADTHVTAQPATSPVPAPINDPVTERSETEVTFRFETRRWRVRGLTRNTTLGVLRINLMIFNERNDRFHVDTLDLYHARARRAFLAEAAEETALGEHELRSDAGRLLLQLERLQHEQLHSAKAELPAVALSDTERREALELLADERLLDRILADFDACGIVGEQTGKLAGYLAATSRLLDRPLGLLIQSSSAAGKSALAGAVLRFMPPEACFTCSAMTGQSLYYLGKENLQHKILSVAEEEGVREASYQLKLLQSEGRLSLVSTSKESGTGRTTAERYDVRGPVALLMTTTSLNVDPELMNRCLVISVDESAGQTAAILRRQRFAETREGFEQQLRSKKVVALHQNAQRLLRRLPVFNPYAEQLGFLGRQTRHRRDHQKYLSLIKAVTLLHQYQRDVKRITAGERSIEYIEVTPADIERANRIAEGALGRSIDELSGPTRRLLGELEDWVGATARAKRLDPSEIVFTRREAREALGWGSTQLNCHLQRLCREEYAVRHAGGDNGKLCRYSLLCGGPDNEDVAQRIGLIDAASLAQPQRSAPTTAELSA